jgi:deoxyribodipyrimidine photo-lyase
MPVPAIRVHQVNSAPIRTSGSFVLYWMIAARRLTDNFALDRALEHCRALKKPLLIFEALRCSYNWASDRFHSFVMQGMADNAATAGQSLITYYPYLEDSVDAGKGLLEAFSADACIIVTDEFPCFSLPSMVAAAAKRLSVRLEAVDSNGLLPLRQADHAFPSAYAFRRFLHKNLQPHLSEFPLPNPLLTANFARGAAIPGKIQQRWPQAPIELLAGKAESLAKLPIDHSVATCEIRGGHTAAENRFRNFLAHKFKGYGEQRNEPESDATSGLSPYLHFGHVSVHEIFRALMRAEKWKPENVSLRATGSREGWWNMSADAESFLDELITWRELGFNFCAYRDDFDKFESLPGWAQKTLKTHARDERAHLYTPVQLESAETHDALWNAAQTQLICEGRIHNYLRMLWGKKILEWSKSPQQAAKIMIHLNNKYGLDGRDPNSYSGIFWVLGRYDRPWGPERAIFGTIRYMSSENTARKFGVKNYIKRYAARPQILPKYN